MPLKIITTAGARVRLSDTSVKVTRVNMLFAPTNDSTTIVYGGYAGEANNVGASVSSSAYDFALNSAVRELTIGEGASLGTSIDLSNVWLDCSKSGDGVVWFSEVL